MAQGTAVMVPCAGILCELCLLLQAWVGSFVAPELPAKPPAGAACWTGPFSHRKHMKWFDF